MTDLEKEQWEAIRALAPAAGTGVGSALAQRFFGRPDWLDKLEASLINALGAEHRVYGGKGVGIITYPDGKTQLAAVLGLMSHMDGEPVKRIIHEVRRGRDAESLQDELTRSPALREAAREMLDAAEKSAGSGAAVEPSAVIDLPPADGAAGSF
jgi:hypothetical protein